MLAREDKITDSKNLLINFYVALFSPNSFCLTVEHVAIYIKIFIVSKTVILGFGLLFMSALSLQNFSHILITDSFKPLGVYDLIIPLIVYLIMP